MILILILFNKLHKQCIKYFTCVGRVSSRSLGHCRLVDGEVLQPHTKYCGILKAWGKGKEPI